MVKYTKLAPLWEGSKRSSSSASAQSPPKRGGGRRLRGWSPENPALWSHFACAEPQNCGSVRLQWLQATICRPCSQAGTRPARRKAAGGRLGGCRGGGRLGGHRGGGRRSSPSDLCEVRIRRGGLADKGELGGGGVERPAADWLARGSWEVAVSGAPQRIGRRGGAGSRRGREHREEVADGGLQGAEEAAARGAQGVRVEVAGAAIWC
jgi:hypothetical protein